MVATAPTAPTAPTAATTPAAPTAPPGQDEARLEGSGLLAPVPIFRNLSTDEQEELAAASQRMVFRPGEVIVRQGEEGNSVFVILEGRVEVRAGVEFNGAATESVVSWLVAGDTVGELSLFDTDARGRRPVWR